MFLPELPGAKQTRRRLWLRGTTSTWTSTNFQQKVNFAYLRFSPAGARLSLPRPSLLSLSFSSLSKRSLSLRSSSVSGGMSAIVRTRPRPRNSGLRRGPGLSRKGHESDAHVGWARVWSNIQFQVFQYCWVPWGAGSTRGGSAQTGRTSAGREFPVFAIPEREKVKDKEDR